MFIEGTRVDSLHNDKKSNDVYTKLVTGNNTLAQEEQRVRKEIFDKLSSSATDKTVFTSLQQAEDYFKLRIALIAAIKEITRQDKPRNARMFTYGSFSTTSKYWIAIPVGSRARVFGFQMKKGDEITPFRAIQDLANSHTKGECVTALQLAVLMALAKITSNPDDFNQCYNELFAIPLAPLGDETYYQYPVPRHISRPPFVAQILDKQDSVRKQSGLLSSEKKRELAKLQLEMIAYQNNPTNYVPGDLVVIINSPFYREVYSNGDWQAENVVYLGKDRHEVPRFSGLGLPNATMSEIKAKLKKELEKDNSAIDAAISRLAQDSDFQRNAKKCNMTPEAYVRKVVYEDFNKYIGEVAGVYRVNPTAK